MKYSYIAVWKYDQKQYLCIDDGDAESGMMPPVAYVGDFPTVFASEEACRKWMRGWPRGSFIIKKFKED